VRLGWGSNFRAVRCRTLTPFGLSLSKPSRGTSTRTATAQCPRHPSHGPLRGKHLQCSLLGEVSELAPRAQTAAASDPQKLRASSPVLLLSGVGIAPQQRALGAQRCKPVTVLFAVSYALDACTTVKLDSQRLPRYEPCVVLELTAARTPSQSSPDWLDCNGFDGVFLPRLDCFTKNGKSIDHSPALRSDECVQFHLFGFYNIHADAECANCNLGYSRLRYSKSYIYEFGKYTRSTLAQAPMLSPICNVRYVL
jgi:hypothetical protein